MYNKINRFLIMMHLFGYSDLVSKNFIYNYSLVETMNHRRAVMLMIVMLIIFVIIFFLAFIGLQTKESLIGIGIPAEFENWVIMILSIGSIVKIVWELYSLETHKITPM